MTADIRKDMVVGLMADGRQSMTWYSAPYSAPDAARLSTPPRSSAGASSEVGVGTGLSLPAYARSNSIFGVDISAPMLQRARKRVARLRLDHVEGLAVMDAEDLTFPDASFDVVVAQYVVTAVPHPERALDELVRVVRPGGEIIITSRIGAEAGCAACWRKH